MLNVLIIDDEKLVRAMVRQCIDWEEIGLQVVGEASSARIGMEIMKELHVDIIVMDIKMPGMNGLVCSQQILEKNPRMKIIILSGHDDFEYASEGIHIGVTEYLLKPVNAKELRSAVSNARDQILSERNHQEEFNRYKEELKKHATYIKDRQLFGFLSSSNPKQYMESLSYFDIQITKDLYQVALVEPKHDKDATEEDKMLTKMLVRKLIEDYYGDIPGIYTADSGAEWIIILNNESEEVVYDTGDNLERYLEDNIETPVCLYIGNVYQEMDQARESYREAKDAAKYRFSSGENVICFRDVYPYYDAGVNAGNRESLIHELGNAVRIGKEDAAEEKLQMILDDFRKAGGKREQAVIQALEIFAEIMKVFSELKLPVYSDTMNYSVLVGEIFKKESFDEIEYYLKDVIKEACLSTSVKVADQEKSLVHKVKDAIEEEYDWEDMSLNTLAQKYFTNPSYLSRVFKEKTGCTFTGYLLDIRMKAAQDLVLHTDMKAYEIAARVGISDPHYFSSCFKKYTGMSVAEYKKTMSQ